VVVAAVAAEMALSDAVARLCSVSLSDSLQLLTLTDDSPSDFDIVVSVGGLELDGLHRRVAYEAADRGVCSLSVRVGRHMVEIGPCVFPGLSACLECYAHRLEAPEQGAATAISPSDGTSPDSFTVVSVQTALAFLAGQLTMFEEDPLDVPTVACVKAISIEDIAVQSRVVHQVRGCHLCRLGAQKFEPTGRR
jgi:hypothetical protein